jgi:hypothetical protein
MPEDYIDIDVHKIMAEKRLDNGSEIVHPVCPVVEWNQPCTHFELTLLSKNWNVYKSRTRVSICNIRELPSTAAECCVIPESRVHNHRIVDFEVISLLQEYKFHWLRALLKTN